MHPKADADGRPHIVFLQAHLDGWLASGAAPLVRPITDPVVAHLGSLGSLATVYVSRHLNVGEIIARLQDLPGIDMVLARDGACDRFELPPDRTGDVVVCADADTVLGTRASEHDLSQLRAPLRSHGGL